MNVNALQKILKFGLDGCHKNGTLASNSQRILRTTKPVTGVHLRAAVRAGHRALTHRMAVVSSEGPRYT